MINTEWTINGAAKPLRDLDLITVWDKVLDRECDAPGFQPFEYMTAGRYLGELVRIIFLIWSNAIAGYDLDDLPEQIRTRNQLTTTFLATVVAPAEDARTFVKILNQNLPAPKQSKWTWDLESADMIRKAAKAVQLRSSALIAAAIVGLLACAGELELDSPENHVSEARTNGFSTTNTYQDTVTEEKEELVVAYTGSLITLYPGFKEETQRRIDRLLEHTGRRNRGKRVVLREASDGGIIGAGVLAGTVVSG